MLTSLPTAALNCKTGIDGDGVTRPLTNYAFRRPPPSRRSITSLRRVV